MALLCWLISYFLLVSAITAAAPTELCGILDQRTAIVGNKLYFSSGNYTYNDDQPIHNDSTFYSLDLTKRLDVSGSIPLTAFDRSTLPSTDLVGGLGPITGGYSGAFFYDHTVLFAYAGIVSTNSNGSTNKLWSYSTTNGSWALTPITGGKIAFGDNYDGVYASDPASGRSFYTGGYKMTYNNTNNGIVRFDTKQGSWNFATAQSGIQGPNILSGTMAYLRKGSKGVLLAFGGFNTTYRGTQFGPGWDWDYRSMADIFIYDIDSNTWYFVKADGAIPPERSEFCSGVSAAPDDSSFQVTIHGGYDLFTRRILSDVYVLTVPAFTWIKVEDQNSPDVVNGSTLGRNRHRCDMWQERQMILTGSNAATGCNQSYPPIKVLDTTTYQWKREFDPSSAEYQVPNVVFNVVGGDSSGGATATSPRAGWNSTDLAGIFSQTVARDTYVPPGNNDSSQSKSSKSSNTAGIIAGSVVGSIVAIALIALCIWLILRRKRSKKLELTSGLTSGFEKAELDASMTAHKNAVDSSPQEMPGEHEPVELPPQTRLIELYAGN